MVDELEHLDRYIDIAKQKFDSRLQLRELNLQENIVYPDDSVIESRDSSIKKNSAFVKKLKTYSEAQRCHILEEIDRLNLTKFTSEIASSLVESKLKLSDIPSVIEVCTKLNRSYRDFHKHLLHRFINHLPSLKRRAINDFCLPSSLQCSLASSSHAQNAKSLSVRDISQPNEPTQISATGSKLRVDLRLFAELLIVGILPLKDAFQVLTNSICYLMSDKNIMQNANALSTLFKGCSDELLGLVPVRVQQLATKYRRDIPTSSYVTAKRQCFLINNLKGYYQNLQKSLLEIYNDLDCAIMKHQKICKAKGELARDARDVLESRCIEFQKLQNIVNQFAEILDEPAPIALKLHEIDVELIGPTKGHCKSPSTDVEVEPNSARFGSIWDDDGTRSFYEELVDLGRLFPDLSVKLNSIRLPSDDSLNRSKVTEEFSASPDVSSAGNIDQDEDASSTSTSSLSDEENHVDLDSDYRFTAASIVGREQPDQYFNKLSDCVNRDMIDNAAIDFIKFFNTKFGRKKLVKTLFNVQRTRLDLLPFFARLTATIYPYVPSVGHDMSSQLKSEFRYLFKKKDQINIESKVKNVRYIGEFIKFNLIHKTEAIGCLKVLLSDFAHHHIEMTCNLLETCGRLLHRSAETHNQLKTLLEQLMRKKLLLSVDSKYVTMIENAYYSTNPPDIIKQAVIETPVQQYVRYLLYECLNRTTIDKVLTKLKLLQWDDKDLAKFVINRLIEAYNVKYYNIRYFAALLAALNKTRPWISICVIDGVVEDILLMMEINETQFNQRRIPMIRYFGELYNYRLSDSSLVFKILYSLITYGTVYPDPEEDLRHVSLSPLDPPQNFFRIKLACDLLDTSGPYLNGSQEKKKLDCYLLFFQRYYWCKKHIFMLHPCCSVENNSRFPLPTEYLYNDTVFNLRPGFHMAASYSEAIDCLQNFVNNLQNS